MRKHCSTLNWECKSAQINIIIIPTTIIYHFLKYLPTQFQLQTAVATRQFYSYSRKLQDIFFCQSELGVGQNSLGTNHLKETLIKLLFSIQVMVRRRMIYINFHDYRTCKSFRGTERRFFIHNGLRTPVVWSLLAWKRHMKVGWLVGCSIKAYCLLGKPGPKEGVFRGDLSN